MSVENCAELLKGNKQIKIAMVRKDLVEIGAVTLEQCNNELAKGNEDDEEQVSLNSSSSSSSSSIGDLKKQKKEKKKAIGVELVPLLQLQKQTYL